MLNTMSPAHNKIFGAKFLSFERLETTCLYTVGYAVFRRSVIEFSSPRSHFYTPIEPLLHSHTFTLVIQHSLYHTLKVPLSDRKRGYVVKRRYCFHG